MLVANHPVQRLQKRSENIDVVHQLEHAFVHVGIGLSDSRSLSEPWSTRSRQHNFMFVVERAASAAGASNASPGPLQAEVRRSVDRHDSRASQRPELQ